MKRMAYMISVMAIAAMIGGCGTQAKTGNGEAAEVRPKEAAAQTASNNNTENQNTQNQGTAYQKAGQGAGDSGRITEDEAKAIAFQDAEVDEADVSGVRVKLDIKDGAKPSKSEQSSDGLYVGNPSCGGITNDGVYEYEVEFYVGNLEYDYDIDAATGRIVSMDRDIEDDFQITDGASGQIISEDEAKKVALAKVPQATEQDMRIHLDQDDGRRIYEGSIYVSGVEYEFEIDAASGVLLEWEEDD